MPQEDIFQQGETELQSAVWIRGGCRYSGFFILSKNPMKAVGCLGVFFGPGASGSCSLEMRWRRKASHLRPPGVLSGSRESRDSFYCHFLLFLSFFSLFPVCQTFRDSYSSHLTCHVTPVTCSRNMHTPPPLHFI